MIDFDFVLKKKKWFNKWYFWLVIDAKTMEAGSNKIGQSEVRALPLGIAGKHSVRY